MAFLNDRVLDNGLTVLDTEVDEVHICSAEPATYADIATYTLGNKTAPSIAAPADGTPNGRAAVLAAFADGDVTATGTASHYALVDTANSRLLAANALAASQAVTSGNLFSFPDTTIRIPDGVSV